MKRYRVQYRICALFVLGLLTACNEPPPPPPTITLAVPTLPRPTERPTPTPIPGVSGAQLGGPYGAFPLPPPFMYYKPLNYSTTIAGQPVFVVIQDGGSPDVLDRVREITVYQDDTATHSWDAETATAIATTFLPPDAVHLRDEPTEIPPHDVVEHVYRSKLLAASLNASVFVDEVDLTTRNSPGTFTWWCAPFPSNTPGFGLCKISPAAPKP